MDKLEKTNAREILKHIKQIYSLKMVRDVFDNEVGIFMPKATVDYLFKRRCKMPQMNWLIGYRSMTVQIFIMRMCKQQLRIFKSKRKRI